MAYTTPHLRWALAGAAAAAVVVAAGIVETCDGDGPSDEASTETAPPQDGKEEAAAPSPEGSEPESPPRLPMARPLPADRCGAPAGASLDEARTLEDHCAWVFASDLAAPRGIISDDAGHVLVIERGEERVTALVDADGNRVIQDGERHPIAGAPGLNHGLAVHDGHLYASSDTTVYRWPYEPGSTEAAGEPQVVIRGMPSGGHSTRTLVADDEDHLYVNIGSQGNVDRDSSRARVMRYDLSEVPDGGLDWERGELFADGLRNEVALAFDSEGVLWGVQNGMDDLHRDDLGGDIHADNPAEDLNRLDTPGRFYGYPYCWTEYDLPAGVGRGRGSQWAHPDFRDDGTHDDAWCRDPDRVVPPDLAMQPHAAPLDLLFWRDGSLPQALVGDALVSLHGSWNRPVPAGYKVVRVAFDDDRPVRVDPLLEYGGEGDTGESWPHRPVGLTVGPRGALLITSDASGKVLALARSGE
ncbi:MAG: PQQ-dependent sugar dehydrogenase [Myxococcota bacterium]